MLSIPLHHSEIDKCTCFLFSFPDTIRRAHGLVAKPAIAKSVGKWLSGSRDRDGKRLARMKRQMEKAPEETVVQRSPVQVQPQDEDLETELTFAEL